MDYLFLALGFALLIIGGDFLVKGAVGLAIKAGISALTIGMTIVSFGTSAPELLVSIKSAFQPGENNLMSVGNIVGSNIANLSLVLGVTVLICPIAIKKVIVYRDWPILMVSTLLASIFMADLVVDRVEGIVLFSGLIAFTIIMLRKSSKNSDDDIETDDAVLEGVKKPKPFLMNVFFICLGVGGLTFGSDLLVSSASSIASSFGVSPFVIGVTVLAFGTSIPELVTSGIAAARKQTDLAVGNLIGSNIFNILSVLGLTAIITPVPLTQSIFSSDVIWMIGIAMLLFPLMILKKRLEKWKGLLLVFVYLLYVLILLKLQ